MKLEDAENNMDYLYLRWLRGVYSDRNDKPDRMERYIQNIESRTGFKIERPNQPIPLYKLLWRCIKTRIFK